MRAPALTDLTAPPPIAPRATGGTGAPGFPDALRMAQIRVTPADMTATVPATSTPAQTTQAPTIPAAPIPASPQIIVRRMTPEQPSHPKLAEGMLSTEIAQPSRSEIPNAEGIATTDTSPAAAPAPEARAVTPQAVAPDAPLAPDMAVPESIAEETHPADIQTPGTTPTDAVPVAAPLTPAQPEAARAVPGTAPAQQAPAISAPEVSTPDLPTQRPPHRSAPARPLCPPPRHPRPLRLSR